MSAQKAKPCTPERETRIAEWMQYTAAYLRICEHEGWDPGLDDPETHEPETKADLRRFALEVGGVAAAESLAFRTDPNSSEIVRGWFRYLCGEGAVLPFRRPA